MQLKLWCHSLITMLTIC